MTKTNLTSGPRLPTPASHAEVSAVFGEPVLPGTERGNSREERTRGLLMELSQQITGLGYSNFRSLVAGLNVIRDGKQPTFKGLSDPHLSIIAEVLTELHTLVQSASPPGTDRDKILNDVATDAILVARRFCEIGGINIIDPNNHRALLRQDRSIQVMSGHGAGCEIIRIELSNNPKGALLVSIIDGGDGQTINDQRILPSGGSLVCGRKPTTSRPFGVEVNLSRGVASGPLCAHEGWSRGCLLVVNEGGKIGLFDRGSRNQLSVKTYRPGRFKEELSHTEYRPEVTKDGTGSPTFGHSVAIRRESAPRWSQILKNGLKRLGL